MEWKMNHNFRPDSCPEWVHHLLNKIGPLTLQDLYEKLDDLPHSSIRRSLYTLQDEFIVEKTEDNTKWKLV